MNSERPFDMLRDRLLIFLAVVEVDEVIDGVVEDEPDYDVDTEDPRATQLEMDTEHGDQHDEQ